MIPRLFSATPSLAFALTVGTALGAASAGTAAADSAVVTYHIDNDHQQVTVKDGAGRTLLTCHAATPTLQAVLDIQAAAGKSKPVGITLTLEDRGGLRLWSTPVSAPSRLKSANSAQFACKSSTDAPGSQVVFTFSSDAPGAAEGRAAPASMSVVCLLGADGRFVSMKSNDSDGQTVSALSDPNGVSVTASDGTVAHVKLDDTGMAFDLNGAKATGVWVKRGGKDYFSFPWNGHQVLLQNGCSFSVGPDGDLTINAPAGPAKT